MQAEQVIESSTKFLDEVKKFIRESEKQIENAKKVNDEAKGGSGNGSGSSGTGSGGSTPQKGPAQAGLINMETAKGLGKVAIVGGVLWALGEVAFGGAKKSKSKK